MLAPLLEKMAVEVFIYPVVVLLLALVIAPLWGRLPLPFRNAFGSGREVLWMVPVLLLGVWLTALAGPWFERVAPGRQLPDLAPDGPGRHL